MSRHEYSSNTKILIICQSIVKQHSINQSINRWNKSGQDHSSCSFPDSGIPSTNPLYLGNLYRESRSMGHRGRDCMVVELSMPLPSKGHRSRDRLVVELSMPLPSMGHRKEGA
jgi:hypothetical protein